MSLNRINVQEADDQNTQLFATAETGGSPKSPKNQADNYLAQKQSWKLSLLLKTWSLYKGGPWSHQ